MTRRVLFPAALSVVLALAAAQDDACPLIDGARACVPVLGACESCNPNRGPGDPVCAESLLCDATDGDAVCRGADVNEKCGNDSGKDCDEGLFCATLTGSGLSGRQEDRCFVAGGEGDPCETNGFSLSDSQSSDPRFRRGCEQGLLCYDGGDGRGAACYPDDGREETCGDRFTPPESICSRADEACFEGVCRKYVPFGGTCEPGSSNCLLRGAPSACVEGEDGEGFKCREVVGTARACGGLSVCRRRGLVEFFEGDVNLRCEAGYCAEDDGAGGLFQLCDSNADCAGSSTATPAGRACVMAEDGNRRCLDLDNSDKLEDPFGIGFANCATSSEYARKVGLSTLTCPAGLSCKLDQSLVQRGLGIGRCVRDALAQVGERCNFAVPCVEDDGESANVVCSDQTCLRRLRNGESCATQYSTCESGSCGGSCLGDLSAAACDSSKVCQIENDVSCFSDSDCDTSTGQTCVTEASSPHAGQKGCYDYNRQQGQSCKSDSFFGSAWDEACADGLICLENEPGRGSIQGRCVRLAKDGERCSPEEGIECVGVSLGGPNRSVCNNGTCRPLAQPR